LAELGKQGVAPVLPGARIDEEVAGQGRQAESVVEFAKREQTGIGGDGGAGEFELQAAVEIEPETTALAFTRRIAHPPPPP
jgi:hypothetical protein